MVNLKTREEEEAPPDSSALMKSMIASRFAPQISQELDQADPTDALKGAQEQAQKNKLYAGLGQSASNLGYAIAGVKNPNPNSFEQSAGDANAPVENLLTQQKVAAQSTALRKQKSLDDPNSMQSNVARNLAKAQLKEAGQDTSIVEGLSAADLSEFGQKGIGALENVQMRKEVANTNAEMRRQGLTDRAALAKDRQEAKVSLEQGKQYQKLRHDLETFRGNTAAQQAAVGILSADKALDIIKGKDPNTLTTQDLNLFAGEMAKLATGGVPTEHGVVALVPNNLKTKWAELQSFLQSKPTDAQAGEYIRHNIEYLQKMRDTSQATLDDYRRNLTKGYKHLVHPTDMQEAMTDYHLNVQPQQSAAAMPQAMGGPSDSVQVRLPNGKTGMIPKSNLAAAVKRGAQPL